MTNHWHLYFMALIYIIAGIFHFVKPGIYKRIIPRFLPKPLTLVYISGIAEIVLGIMIFFQKTRTIALLGIAGMLTVFLIVHFNMVLVKKARLGLPMWLLIIRIPLQFLLILWALYYIKI